MGVLAMKEIEIIINKEEVYNEIARTTAYTGAKMKGDDTAYDRIYTTDADKEALGRFWDEACNVVTGRLKEFTVSENSSANGYELRMEMSSAWDEILLSGMKKSISGFFVNYIVSKWNKWVDKDEVQTYASDAALLLADVVEKAYYRKKPKRVIPKI